MQDQLQIITLILKQPQGLIVLAGPTGCGKSSTLHAMLMHCQREHSNIIALEDPVEVGLDGVHQMGMNPAVGLDFSDVLPYVLRADPDIIMVGEVRDAKTAQMALSAAQTGHLVLTTVHGASMGAALSRLQRLAKMSGDDFAITLQLLVEQRLLRKHCELCCGYGCGQCHQGISGRQGIFACHAMQSERLLKKDLSDFCASSSAELRQRAIQYFDQGIVSSAEIDRVLGSESSLTIH